MEQEVSLGPSCSVWLAVFFMLTVISFVLREDLMVTVLYLEFLFYP